MKNRSWITIVGVGLGLAFLVGAIFLPFGEEAQGSKGRRVERKPKSNMRMIAQDMAGPIFLGSDTSRPYEWNIDTTQFPNGPKTFWAVAYDAAGNQTTSESVTIMIDNSFGFCNDNGICETDEDCEICPGDCPQTEISCCGNGFCEFNETCSNCEIDCEVCPFCGDGTCNSNENVCNCPGDCGSPPVSEQLIPDTSNFTCNNGIDDDCDGSIDCNDSDCFDDPNCIPPCVVTENPEISCSDGVDNDCDFAIDCLDNDCDINPDCIICTPTETPEATCDDNIDNDCDGTTDCGDADCASIPPCVECATDADCDDGNPCTNESCSGGSCLRANNSLPCDDGKFCTATDVCSGGSCVGGGIKCPGELCNETNNTCDPTVPPLCNNNGICDGDENCTNCSNDCAEITGAVCGNTRCETRNGENCLSCPADCSGVQSGKKRDRYCCGAADVGTNPIPCSDPRCNRSGKTCTSIVVINSCCGDNICEGNENACDCEKDCGQQDLQEFVNTSCRDGIDNDCDSTIDCDDPDCVADSTCRQGCDHDGRCETGENCQNCSDCAGVMKGKPALRHCCGNGQIERVEVNSSICDGNP